LKGFHGGRKSTLNGIFMKRIANMKKMKKKRGNTGGVFGINSGRVYGFHGLFSKDGIGFGNIVMLRKM
jgi:copper oxidase (laccase) domain-containing protein